LKTDVIVLGAGAAGIAAAFAAAESGLEVILLERYGFLGGMATAAMVGTVCGQYYRGGSEPRYALDGFARKFSEGLARRSATEAHVFGEGLYFLPYQPEAFHLEAAQHLKQAGVRLLLHTLASQVKVDEGVIMEINATAPDRQINLQADAFVDCSGEAILSILADQEMIEEPCYQAGALVFLVAGLPEMDAQLLGLNLIRWIKKGIHGGKLHADCDRLTIVPGTLKNANALLKLGMPVPLKPTVNSRTEYELLARSRAYEIVAYLKDTVSLLKSLTILVMAPQVGIRSGQRPLGIEKLEANDLLSCYKPDNGIAIGAWPIEKWGEKKKPEMIYFDENDHYEIPAGALVSRCLSNLFFAGRGISASEDAIASARVIGTCLSTGYAAGKLAAGNVSDGGWPQAIEKIRCAQILPQQR
jgi:hypothetical protein